MYFVDGTFGRPYTPTGWMRSVSAFMWGGVPASSPGVAVRHVDLGTFAVPERTISIGIDRLTDRPIHDANHRQRMCRASPQAIVVARRNRPVNDAGVKG